GVTLFMAVLAAWQMLLSRYSRQPDVVVGTDVANRNRLEIEKLIGFFVNQLVLRSRVESAESFSSLLQRVRRMTLEAYEHQDVPFEKLVEEIAPERDLSRSPLFQVKLVLDNAPQEGLRLGGLQTRLLETRLEMTKLDLRLGLNQQRDGGLAGRLEYSTDLFARESIERMVRHWTQLVEEILTHPEQSIGQLSLLSESERRQLLVEWNGAAEEFPQATVIELIEQQAALRAEAIAAVYEKQSLSYGELNRRANQLAHYLQGIGVG